MFKKVTTSQYFLLNGLSGVSHNSVLDFNVQFSYNMVMIEVYNKTQDIKKVTSRI